MTEAQAGVHENGLVVCPDGEFLYRAGDPVDGVYLVEDGSFEVLFEVDGKPCRVGLHVGGDIVGHASSMMANRRLASARAVGVSSARPLTDDELAQWSSASAENSDALSRSTQRIVTRSRAARVVAMLFDEPDTDVVADVLDALDWHELAAGETLFTQGDAPDAAWIVISGQLRITQLTDGETTLDTRVGRAALVGELGVIDDAPRNATVVASRDTSLARLSSDAFARLTAKHPALMLRVARGIIERARRRPEVDTRTSIVAVVDTTNGPSHSVLEAFAEEMARHGSVSVVEDRDVTPLLAKAGGTTGSLDRASRAMVVEALMGNADRHDFMLLDASSNNPAWQRIAIQNADRVLLVTTPWPDRAAREQIRHTQNTMAGRDIDCWAAVWAPAGSHRWAETAQSLTGANRVLRIAGSAGADDPTTTRSLRRLARLVIGRGLGVAFSGGGARALAHAGVVRAMHELGLEIDAVSGTSMGSVIAATLALEDDPAGLADRMRTAFADADLLDYTLPLCSIFSGRKLAERLDDEFGEQLIEDTLLPLICVSTNLTRAHVVDHDRGPIVRAVRASVSLPGVFPPVVDGDDLLVDGGVLENLPVRPLIADAGVGTVIGVDVAPPTGPRAKGHFDPAVRGRDVVRARMSRRSSYPALTNTLITSMLVGSSQARRQVLDDDTIDAYFSLNLTGIKLLDFSAAGEAIDRGYEEAKPLLTEWQQRDFASD